MKKIYYYAFILLIIAGTYFYTNWRYSLENVHKDMLEDIKEESYNGTIIKKYTAKKGKYPVHILQLNKDQKAEPGRRFWEKTAVGDSVVKVKGSDFATVYKKDGTTDTFNYTKWLNEVMKEE